MDRSNSLEKICRDELGLSSAGSDQLQTGVKKYIEAWDVFAMPGEQFSELNDATVSDFVERYLDQGWNRDERVEKGTERGMKVAPGKRLWPRNGGSKRLRYEYPKDANIIRKGVEKVFHTLKHNDRDAIPITSYPTPISAKKRNLSNNADKDSSSETDSSDEDVPDCRKAQASIQRNSESLLEEDRRDQQGPKDSVAVRTPALTPDNLRLTTAALDTGNEGLVEPQQGLVSPSHTKSLSTRRKASNTKDISGRPNQLTLKGFITISKPLTPKDKRKDPVQEMASIDAGQLQHIRATSPAINSDDESLPRSPREYFGLKNHDKERTPKEEDVEVSLQAIREPSDIETPCKRRKTGRPSILRSSNTVKVRKLLERRPPPTVLHTEEHCLESALCPTSIEAQLSDPPPDECRGRDPSTGQSVDDSVGSPSPRNMSRAPSIDLGDPPSETELLPEEAILPRLPLAGTTTTSRQISDLGEVASNVESSLRSESRSSVNFWVLRTSKPHNKWIHWADATLFQETIDSMFNALHKFTGNLGCTTIDVQLQTSQEEYSFQLKRDHSDRFEAMKAFMLQKIDASHCGRGFDHTVTSIYLRPDIEIA